jgi:hypothetical protein
MWKEALTFNRVPSLTPMPSPSSTRLLVLLTLLVLIAAADAQAIPTAQRSIDVTAFLGDTSNFTGLSAGHNSSVTAGVDLAFPEFHLIRPSIELRATDPYNHGFVNSEKDILVGPRAELRFGPVHPYLDLLVGRGTNTFVRPYTLPSGAFLYSQAPSTVVSPGVGARLNLIGNLSAFADSQIQLWNTPASLSGHLLAKPLTLGLVYRFTWSHNGFPTH